MIFHFMPALTLSTWEGLTREFIRVHKFFFVFWNKDRLQRREAIFSSSMKKNEKQTLSQAHTASLTTVVCQTVSDPNEILGKAINIYVRLSDTHHSHNFCPANTLPKSKFQTLFIDYLLQRPPWPL